MAYRFHDDGSLLVPSYGSQSGGRIVKAYTKDSMLTFDRVTIDSTGVFLIGELERLDMTLHMPLAAVSWQRDVDLREDVSVADEVSSFTNSSFASAGGMDPGGIAWIAKDANAITGVALDIGKTAHPLNLWGMEIKFTLPELISAQKAGRPVDSQKYEGMKLKYQMDVDQLVYFGDPILGTYGLLNSDSDTTTSQVTNVTNVAAGSNGSLQWVNKTPDEILNDVNELLTSVWAASAWAQMPNRLLIPPAMFGYIVQNKVSDAGNLSIMRYLLDNNITVENTGANKLEIHPAKWTIGIASGGTQGTANTGFDRMCAYTKDKDRVRFPMTSLQKTPLEYKSLWQLTTYFGRLGQIEVVYPETIGYRDKLA